MENQQFSNMPPQSQNPALSGIGDLLSRSWQIYKNRFWVFIGIMVIPTLIVLIFGIATAGLVLGLQSSPEALLLSLGIWIILLPIVILIILTLYLLANIALIVSIIERERKIGIKEAFALGRGKILSYLWVSILTGLAVVVGLLLLIVPGIIFAVWFSFASYVLIAEGVTGTRALSRSKELVSGYWWAIFWRFLALVVIAIIISIIVGLIKELIGLSKQIDISSFFNSLVFSPFAAVYTFLIYEELKRIKGGTVI